MLTTQCRWYLYRLGPKNEEVRLKFGDNMMGRQEDSDVIIESIFSSRKHCTITITDDNRSVILKDLETSNGTYINTVCCRGQTLTLRSNDEIGIGCLTSLYPETKYVVFKLKSDLAMDPIPIIIDDDEAVEDSNDCATVFDEIKREALEFENSFNDFCNVGQSQVPEINVKCKEENITTIDDSDDDVICISDCDENDSEDDEKVKNWMFKLSQNITNYKNIKKENSDEVIDLDEDEFDLIKNMEIKKELLLSQNNIELDINFDGQNEVNFSYDLECDINYNESGTVEGTIDGRDDLKSDVKEQLQSSILQRHHEEITEDRACISIPSEIFEKYAAIPSTTPLPIQPLNEVNLENNEDVVPPLIQDNFDENKELLQSSIKHNRLEDKLEEIFGPNFHETEKEKLEPVKKAETKKKKDPKNDQKKSKHRSRHKHSPERKSISSSTRKKSTDLRKSKSSDDVIKKNGKTHSVEPDDTVKRKHKSKSSDSDSEFNKNKDSKRSKKSPENDSSFSSVMKAIGEMAKDANVGIVKEKRLSTNYKIPSISREEKQHTSDKIKTVPNKPLNGIQVIEPLRITKKRFMTKDITESLEKNREKINDTTPEILKRKQVNPQNQVRKKFKKAAAPALGLSKQEIANNKKARGKKLQELEHNKSKKNEIDPDMPKVINTPKVKITEKNRGDFLVDDIPKPGPSKRISRVPSIALDEEGRRILTLNTNLNRSTSTTVELATKELSKHNAEENANDQEIVQNVSPVTEINEHAEILQRPTVRAKVTIQNRGAFLVDALPQVVPKRRMSRLASVNEDCSNVPATRLSRINSHVDSHSKSHGDEVPLNSSTSRTDTAKILNNNITPSGKENINKTQLGFDRPRHSTHDEELNDRILSSVTFDALLLLQKLPPADAKPIKPILKRYGSIATEKSGKRVQFRDGRHVCYFEFEHLNPDRPLVKASYQNTILKETVVSAKAILNQKKTPSHHQQVKSRPNNNNNNNSESQRRPSQYNSTSEPNQPHQNIINDVTLWNANWLKGDINKAQVNGENVTLLPMVHIFKSYADYETILIPLMKKELWNSIRKEYDNSRPVFYKAIIRHVINSVSRGTGFRNVYSCEILENRFENDVREGSIILIEFTKTQIFAYVTKKYVTNTDRRSIFLHFESASSRLSDSLTVDTNIRMRFVSYIRAEAASFDAIYNLRHSKLCSLILDPTKITTDLYGNGSSQQFTYKGYDNLNVQQEQILIETYRKCLDVNNPNLVLIHGPPGTGKTRLIANLVTQLLLGDAKKSFKILICSSSNTAVDTITEKLSAIRQSQRNSGHKLLKLVRFGIYEKMSPSVQKHSLDYLVDVNIRQDSEIRKKRNIANSQTMRIMTADKLHIEKQLAEIRSRPPNNINTRTILELEHKLNRIDNIIEGNAEVHVSEIAENKSNTARNLMTHAEIVCVTLSSCISLMRYVDSFDICIIDEATQCNEQWTLMSLQFNISSLILIGDTQQLPATVISKTARENGLANSLFERVEKSFIGTEYNPVVSLTMQYRMHPEICLFPNQYFYGNRLETSNTTIDNRFPFTPYSVVNLEYFQNAANNHIIDNKSEADFIAALIFELKKLTDGSYNIAIITPYQKHKESIVEALAFHSIKGVTVHTIDSYQGQEQDIVIMSMARTEGVGFLVHQQRLNVALTRAKHCLIICGNFISLGTVYVWQKLLQNAKDRNLYHNHDSRYDNINILVDKLKK